MSTAWAKPLTRAQQEQRVIQIQEKERFDFLKEYALMDVIETEPKSFQYGFTKAQYNGTVHIHTSLDHKLKFYNFNVSQGTMGEYVSLAQYQNPQVKTEKFESGYITDIYQIDINHQTV